MAVKLTFKADFSGAAKALTEFRKSQIPFATALALTRLAQGVAALENKQTTETFKSPTLFTQKSFTIKSATKTDRTIAVFPKNISKQYLEPYVFGGNRFLGPKKKMLVPVNWPTNDYGNLARGTVARLKGRTGFFIGGVKTKDGRTVYGVWKRESRSKVTRRKQAAGLIPKGRLTLVIKFEDTSPVPFEFPFFEEGQAYLRANAIKEFRKALAYAMRTTKNRTHRKA